MFSEAWITFDHLVFPFNLQTNNIAVLHPNVMMRFRVLRSKEDIQLCGM